jgi:ParB family chromosome partitioning protein
MLEMALIENIQREDLDPIEVSLSYKRLIDECNITQEQLAKK